VASAAQIALPQIAGPATAGSALETAVSAGRSLSAATSTFRRLGLAMRFKVTVMPSSAGATDLGHWTSCEGLKVEFGFEKVRSGGDYSTVYFLPQAITFGPVTLKRPVEAIYSQKVLTWLKVVAIDWQASGGEPPVGSDVTISMFDVYQNPEAPAMSWQLSNAFPVSWSGPALNAKSNEIGIETLVLEHHGFLETPV
jgi:phage tail-like protein